MILSLITFSLCWLEVHSQVVKFVTETSLSCSAEAESVGQRDVGSVCILTIYKAKITRPANERCERSAFKFRLIPGLIYNSLFTSAILEMRILASDWGGCG